MTDVLGVYFLSGHSVDSGFFWKKFSVYLQHQRVTYRH